MATWWGCSESANLWQTEGTIYGIPCEELPADMAVTHSSFQVVIIIEGREEAADSRDVLKSLLRVAAQHSPIPSDGAFHS